jgi:predicted ATPase
MIKSIKINNFRSIHEKQPDIELAPITLVYGGNGTGKSSLLYSILVLKNILLNPNQSLDGFFNLTVANLGGFEQVVFDHRKNRTIELGISSEQDKAELKYEVSLGSNKGMFGLAASGQWKFITSLEVTFPYPANKTVETPLSIGENTYAVRWNGITVIQVVPAAATDQTAEEARKVNTLLNGTAEALRQVDFIPLRRGFFKPQYSAAPMSPALVGEDEVATFLAQDPYVRGKVSHYLEEITNRAFTTHTPLGTALFFLQSTDKSSGLTTELVNDGFGTNQLVYLLAKALRPETRFVCVEEPEINLHPTSVRKLAQAISRMVREEEKQFLISTHSETLVLALLSQVAKHEIEPEDLACYLATKTKRMTQFERQEVNDKGQIEGGLKSFMEAELEDLKIFLGAK